MGFYHFNPPEREDYDTEEEYQEDYDRWEDAESDWIDDYVERKQMERNG